MNRCTAEKIVLQLVKWINQSTDTLYYRFLPKINNTRVLEMYYLNRQSTMRTHCTDCWYEMAKKREELSERNILYLRVISSDSDVEEQQADETRGVEFDAASHGFAHVGYRNTRRQHVRMGKCEVEWNGMICARAKFLHRSCLSESLRNRRRRSLYTRPWGAS